VAVVDQGVGVTRRVEMAKVECPIIDDEFSKWPRLRFTARRIREVDHGKGYWSTAVVGVFDGQNKIGEYDYNYSHGCPFYAFEQRGQWLALYATDYQTTSVMSLPDCRRLDSKPEDSKFCPVEFYVPAYQLVEYTFTSHGRKVAPIISNKCYDDSEYEEGDPPLTDKPWAYEDFGFQSGCVWGDDSTWKLRLMDLRKAAGGIVTEIPIGYIELAGDLRESVSIDDIGWITTKQRVRMQIKELQDIAPEIPERPSLLPPPSMKRESA
jgi:hypothetical protein